MSFILLELNNNISVELVLSVCLQDWQFVIHSDHHHRASQHHQVLGLTGNDLTVDLSAAGRPCGINQSALLFTFCPSVLLGLHLVYEVSNVAGCVCLPKLGPQLLVTRLKLF